MGVSVEQIMGFTVTLKEKLNQKDFDFFNRLEDNHKEFSYGGEYSQWGGGIKKNKVSLIVDGMCGEYVRLVYVVYTREVGIDKDGYVLLEGGNLTGEIYESLNKAYQMIYGEQLDKNKIEYALWYYWH